MRAKLESLHPKLSESIVMQPWNKQHAGPDWCRKKPRLKTSGSLLLPLRTQWRNKWGHLPPVAAFWWHQIEVGMLRVKITKCQMSTDAINYD